MCARLNFIELYLFYLYENIFFSLHTGGYLLWLCGQAVSETQGAEKIAKVLDDGSALQCFRKMMEAQGAKPDIARNLNSNSKLGKASHIEELIVQTTGKHICLTYNGSLLLHRSHIYDCFQMFNINMYIH